MKEKNKITLILSVVIILLLTGIITLAVIDSNKTHEKDEFYKLKLNDYYYQEEKGIIKDEFDFERIITKYEVDEKDLSFKLNHDKKDYIYYVFNYSPCSEKITYQDLTYKGKTAIINIYAEITCNFCINEYTMLIYSVEKDSIDEVKINIETKELENCDITVEDKPILYIYPTITTNVTVKLKDSSRISTSYPKYNDGWTVTAHPNGDLYDKFNNYYYALYWDEINNTKVDFNEGFYVTKENAITFLEEKLEVIGLSKKERNEFIMYWLPKLEKNEKSLVYFELTESRQNDNELIIEPKPDSLLRINMHIKKVDKEVSIKAQILPTFNRVGFTVVEWGGTIHK